MYIKLVYKVCHLLSAFWSKTVGVESVWFIKVLWHSAQQ